MRSFAPSKVCRVTTILQSWKQQTTNLTGSATTAEECRVPRVECIEAEGKVSINSIIQILNMKQIKEKQILTSININNLFYRKINPLLSIHNISKIRMNRRNSTKVSIIWMKFNKWQ